MNTLDLVVLNKDIPEHCLRAGDIGTLVAVYAPDGLEVEFITGSGSTQALLTLHTEDVRKMGEAEILSVRALQDVA